MNYVGMICNVAKSAITLENSTPPIVFLCEFCKITVVHHYISIWQLSKLGCENVETSIVARLRKLRHLQEKSLQILLQSCICNLVVTDSKRQLLAKRFVAMHLNVACSTTTTALFATTITPLTDNKFSNTKVLCAYPVCCWTALTICC